MSLSSLKLFGGHLYWPSHHSRGRSSSNATSSSRSSSKSRPSSGSNSSSSNDSSPSHPSSVREVAPTVKICGEELEASGVQDSERAKVKTESAPVHDQKLVTWDGEDDPNNPMNWRNKTKWAVTLIVSAFSFVSLVSSTMIAPALPAVAKDLHILSSVESQISMSVFVLSWALGPMFWGPMSEDFGRVRVLQLSNLFYLVFNIMCGFSRNQAELIVGRALAGFGASASQAIGGGILSDCWKPEERGKSISILSFLSLLGPALGPLAASAMLETLSWRWIFYVSSMFDVALQLLGWFVLRESYPPVILHRKASGLRKTTGDPELHTIYETPDRNLKALLRVSLTRSFTLLLTQPIIIILSLYQAYAFGILYIFLSTYPTVWSDLYHEPPVIAGLNYLSYGIGLLLGTQIGTRLSDLAYRRLSTSRNPKHKFRPELRLALMLPASILLPLSVLLFGWSAQYRLHWVIPNLGALLFAIAYIIPYQCIQAYIVDCYPLYAASATGSINVLRGFTAFAFPMFAPTLYTALGWGWGNSVLALAALVLGVPAPVLLWTFGKALRERSTFAAGSQV